MTQDEVVRFLAATAENHVETHLSHVFVAADRVLKLKKAIRWSMVDYSTVDRREHFCREELRVNAVAGDLYVGVVPVARQGGALALGGEGEPVDWVVAMRRFPHQLDAMVDDGTLTPALVDATADAIAAMHRAAPIARVADAADRVAATTAQLARDLGAAEWGEAATRALDAVRATVDRRGRHGFVRRCHGDLHLSNICLWRGRPTPFDAIEFSADVATTDVLYDLAFALVDFEARGREDFAARLLSRWLEATRDYGGLALLPLFRAQRAAVRALTRIARGHDGAPLLALASRALQPPPRRLVAVGGFSGSGKSTVARALAPALGAVVIRSDAVRKRLLGVAPETRLDAAGYAPAVTAAVYRRLYADARRALAAGSAVILDATFVDAAARGPARRLAAALGVPFAGLWLDAPAAVLAARVAGRGPDASDADAAVLAAQLARGAAPEWTRVDASGEPDAVVAAALRAV